MALSDSEQIARDILISSASSMPWTLGGLDDERKTKVIEELTTQAFEMADSFMLEIEHRRDQRSEIERAYEDTGEAIPW